MQRPRHAAVIPPWQRPRTALLLNAQRPYIQGASHELAQQSQRDDIYHAEGDADALSPYHRIAAACKVRGHGLMGRGAEASLS